MKKIELPAALRGSFDDIWLDYARLKDVKEISQILMFKLKNKKFTYY